MKVKIGTVRDILEYMTILFMILDFNTPYSTSLKNEYPLTQITTILIVVLLLVEFSILNIRKNMLNRWILYFIPYYIFEITVFLMSTSRESSFSFFGKFLIIFPIMVLLLMLHAEMGGWDRLLRKFANIVAILAGVSLFFWIFGSQLRILKPTNHIYAEWGNNYNYPMWYGVYTERQYQIFSDSIIFRNQGIFCEGPMYNFVLVVALTYEVFLKNNFGNQSDDYTSLTYAQKPWRMRHGKIFTIRIILLSLTILSTTTTTGIILLIMIAVINYMLNTPRDRIMKVMKPLLAVIVSLVGLYFAIQIFLQKSTSFSWISRADDFRIGFLTFLSSPLWGTGYSLLEGIGGKRTGFSNSIMAILAQGGIFLGLVYLIPMICTLLKSFKLTQYNILAFSLIIIVAFSFTAVSYTFVMLMLVAFFNVYILE